MAERKQTTRKRESGASVPAPSAPTFAKGAEAETRHVEKRQASGETSSSRYETNPSGGLSQHLGTPGE